MPPKKLGCFNENVGPVNEGNSNNRIRGYK